MPSLWVSLFTSDPGVTAAASTYLVWAGPAFAFFGMGACLYFSSQGAAKVGGPVMAGTARLLIVGGGGWWLASAGARHGHCSRWSAPRWSFTASGRRCRSASPAGANERQVVNRT
jgi:Na+-driven multidrug efflux pump